MIKIILMRTGNPKENHLLASCLMLKVSKESHKCIVRINIAH